jgi:predicted lipoprotein
MIAQGRAVPVAAFLLLAACVPWTVRPIGEAGESAEKPGGKFDAHAYLEGVWASRLLPAVEAAATAPGPLLAALAGNREEARKRFALRQDGATAWFAVKGEARVLRVDTASRAGSAVLDVAPFDGRPDAVLAIGPVIRGSVLRDSTGLIPFSRFVNQLDYADVNNALNDRVVEQVIAPVRPSLEPGATISLCGTLAVEAASPGLPEIVPVKLALARAPR